MKKSLVLLMAVVFTLAIASATVAADLSYWVGGDMFYYFDSDAHGLIESGGTFMVGQTIQAKVTNGNTWAQAWLNTDKWRTHFDNVGPDTDNGSGMWRFAFGWTKIGDVLDLGFSTKDTGTANIGQSAITDSFNTFHADPIFNTYDNPYAINAVLALGNLTVKAEYNVATDGAQSNTPDFSMYAGNYAIAFVGKLDSGELHFGYKHNNIDGYLAMIGGNFAIGDASVKVDIWKDHGGMVQDWGTAGTVGTYANDSDDLGVGAGTGVQAAFGYGQASVTLMYVNPEANQDPLVAVAAAYKLDKLTLEAKFFKDYAPDQNAWIVDGLYNVGAFDIKFGAMDRGDADDTSIILGFHAALW